MYYFKNLNYVKRILSCQTIACMSFEGLFYDFINIGVSTLKSTFSPKSFKELVK